MIVRWRRDGVKDFAVGRMVFAGVEGATNDMLH